MKRALSMTSLALICLALPTAAVAADRSALDGAETWATAAPVIHQRRDVEEVSLPQPRSGPHTPIRFCSPSQPLCS